MELVVPRQDGIVKEINTDYRGMDKIAEEICRNQTNEERRN